MMSDEEDIKHETIFSKRAKQAAKKKTPEELKAAEELIKKLEAESAQAELEAKLLGKKGRKRKDLKSSENGTGFGLNSKPGTSSESEAESGYVRKISSTAGKSRSGSGQDFLLESNSQPSTSCNSEDSLNKIILEHELAKTRLPAAAKRRLKKMRIDQETELQTIENENRKILEAKTDDFDLAPIMSDDDDEAIYYIRVTCMSQLGRFELRENENLITLFESVGRFFELQPKEFLLCLKDRNLCVTDTPKSLGLSEYTLLECIPYKQDDSALDHDDNSLLLTFQSNDTKTKIEMVVYKTEKMQSVMERYAFKRSMPLSAFHFEFDGEEILPEYNAIELEMEEGNCIDVTVFVPLPGCSQTVKSSECKDGDKCEDDKKKCAKCASCAPQADVAQTAKQDYFNKYFKDFVFVDSDSNDSDIIALN